MKTHPETLKALSNLKQIQMKFRIKETHKISKTSVKISMKMNIIR